jgi:hypothetical protein
MFDDNDDMSNEDMLNTQEMLIKALVLQAGGTVAIQPETVTDLVSNRYHLDADVDKSDNTYVLRLIK